MAASASNYPTSIDTTTEFPDVTGVQQDGDGDANAVHSTLHNSLASAVIVVEGKLGTGSNKIPRSSTFVVAANDASTAFKAQADYLCDGTDDDVQIQAAIDALSTTYGGRVQLSEGLFNISSSILLKDGTALHGMGRSKFGPDTGTILKAATALDSPVIALNSVNVKHVEIANLVVDGNEANQSSGDGIKLDRTATSLTNAPRDLLQNVQVFDAKEIGINIIQTSGGGGAADLIGCMVSNCGSDGFEIAGTDVFLSHCISLLNTGKGYDLIAGSGAAQFSNCKADSNESLGFHISGAGNVKMFGVEALANESDGIRINQDNCLIVGAMLKDNGTTGTPRAGLDITAGCQYLVATGLQIVNTTGTVIMDYGVELAAGADNILLDGMVSGYDTAYVLNSSGGTVTNRLVDAG